MWWTKKQDPNVQIFLDAIQAIKKQLNHIDNAIANIRADCKVDRVEHERIQEAFRCWQKDQFATASQLKRIEDNQALCTQRLQLLEGKNNV